MKIPKKILIIALILFLVFVILVVIGYLRTRKETQKVDVVEVGEERTPTPVDVGEDITAPPIPLPPGKVQEVSQVYQMLFPQSFFYFDLDYPYLYVYDPQEQVVKYLNLKDETFKEIYRIENLDEGYLSEDKTKFIFKQNGKLSLLDLKIDSFFNLPSTIQKLAFTSKDIIAYLNTPKVSYLAYYQDGKIKKIRDLGILNPEIVFLPKNSLLIYEKESNYPVFLLNLSSPQNLQLFLEPKENYSLLLNKNKDLIFVSYKNESKAINLKKETKMTFPWQTVREKCSFDDVLICAVSSNFDAESWYLYSPNFDEKLVIYDPRNDQIKEIKLEAPVDIVKPKKTPLGILFWNRLDAKFYVIKPEESSL